MKSSTARGAIAALIVITALAGFRWGYHGHTMAGRAAATALPADLPEFFRDAADQLAYLNYEPDRWRGDSFRELNEAMRYDHYVDFEVIPDTILTRVDRFQYLYALQDSGMANPPRDAGLLPFRIVELYQRLVTQWQLWRVEEDPAIRRMIEERIINDAGILGHYVTDGANPHHTSVHHNRWAEGYPNPRGFTTEPGFHGRFESAYVQHNVTVADILPHVRAQPRTVTDVRADVMAYLEHSHARLERLYELDLQERFGPETRGTAHHAFAIERLAAGTNMLRDLWWSAYAESGRPVPERR